MAELKSGLLLQANEKLVMELEAEFWATSSNIIAKIIGMIRKIIAFIFGIRLHGYLVVTDKRVVEITQRRALWIFNVAKIITYVLPASVKEVGFVKSGACLGCFCQAYTLYYEAFTHRREILLKGIDDEESAQRIADAFFKTISTVQIAE